MSPTVAALQAVPWLTELSPGEIEDVADAAERARFGAGQAIVGELELGDDLFIVVRGSARVSVQAGETRRELGMLCAGDACGELSVLTGELRSATVTAVGPVEALRLGRAEFEQLVARHPTIAVHFARAIARRVLDADGALELLLERPGAELGRAAEKLVGRSPAALSRSGSVARAWRELVVSRRRDLPFVALVSFMTSLAAIRLGARAVEAAGGSLFSILRLAYILGIILVFGSTAASLARFRRSVQRALALAFGAGFALILNELSVFLAFDSFYLDMTTPDPNLVFSVETLYRRTESVWAVWLATAFLAQATFLRAFYRRIGFVLRTRFLRLLARRQGT